MTATPDRERTAEMPEIDELQRRLAIGYARIETARASGVDAKELERFWGGILRGYEDATRAANAGEHGEL